MAARRAAKARTFESYVRELYGPWFEAHRKTGSMTVRYLLSRVPELKAKHLSEITAWHVEKWRAARLKEVKPATVNRELATLKAALSKAVEWRLVDGHPLTKVRQAKVDHIGRVRFLDAAEERRLRAALDEREETLRLARDRFNAWRSTRGFVLLPNLRNRPFVDYLKPMVILTLNTGLRRGELFSLKSVHVDLERALLTVVGVSAKSGTTRHVPLNTEALATLRAWIGQTQPADLLFPGKNGKRLTNVQTSWERLQAAAGIHGFRWHDMRHHFASRLVMAGVDLNTVREILGHSDIKMTLRYAHLAPEHKAAAVARLGPPDENVAAFQKRERAD